MATSTVKIWLYPHHSLSDTDTWCLERLDTSPVRQRASCSGFQLLFARAHYTVLDKREKSGLYLLPFCVMQTLLLAFGFLHEPAPLFSPGDHTCFPDALSDTHPIIEPHSPKFAHISAHNQKNQIKDGFKFKTSKGLKRSLA